MALPGQRQRGQASTADDFQRRAGNLYSRRIWDPPGRRYAHHREWRGIVNAAESVAGGAVREVTPASRSRYASFFKTVIPSVTRTYAKRMFLVESKDPLEVRP